MDCPYKFDELPPGASKIYYYPSLDSTSTRLQQLAGEGAPGGAVVLADAQEAGRGRRGRFWHSPPGKGIYFSVLLRPPQLDPAGAAPLTLVAAVAAARELRRAAALPVAVKWPNDLLVGGKKLGGILTEASISGPAVQHIVLGIGLNVNHLSADFPAELRTAVTSLRLERRRSFERRALFLNLLGELLKSCRLFFNEGFAPFQQPWREMSATLGNRVELEQARGTLRGKALDIDSTGALIVEGGEGELHRIFCGEIR